MKSKKSSLVVSLMLPLAVIAFGCDRANQDSSSSTSGLSSAAQTNATMSTDTNTLTNAVDNSGINVRDRDTNNLTAGDQGNSTSDVDLTKKIRNSLVMNTNYSFTAKNVKIITTDGNVTLRGPVNSDAEKNGIESLAKNLAGSGTVTNELEVKTNP